MKRILLLISTILLMSMNVYAQEFDININSEVLDINEQPFDNNVTIVLPEFQRSNVGPGDNVTEVRYIMSDTVLMDSTNTDNVVSNIEKGTEVDLVEFRPDYSRIKFNNNFYIVYSSCLGTEQEVDHIFSNVFDSMTAAEEDETLKMLYLECCNEPFEGKVACVEETFRRVISPKWPNTLHDVIFQRGQFSTARSIKNVVEGQPYKPYGDKCVDLNPLREAMEYVRKNGYTVLPKLALEHGYTITENKDYVFWATYKANGKNFIKIGHHYFGMGNV